VSAVALLFVFAYQAGSLGRLLSTIVTTAIAIAVVGGIWLVSNLILTQARNRWTVYVGVAWGLVAAALFAIMRGNQVLTALFVAEDPIVFNAGSGFWGHVEWPLFGAALWGGGAALMALVPSRLLRLPIGLAIGAVTGWLIAGHTQVWERPGINWGPALGWSLVGIALALGFVYRTQLLTRANIRDATAIESRLPDPVPGALVGALVGWVIAVWLRPAWVPAFEAPRLATMVPLILLGARLAWKDRPTSSQIATLEERGRAAIFLGPAMLFLTAALVVPAIGTVIRSFRSRTGVNPVGFRNYDNLFSDPESFDVSNWSNLFTSQLFWLALILIAAGALIGTFIGTTRNGTASFERSGASIGSISVGIFVLLMGVFAVLRGTFFNNLWWIVTVTVVSVVLGLTIAVLAEQAGRFESVAKSFIFMPMAVSFVGASIVWRLQYQARPVQKSQTGVLNYLWIKLGELSHSGWPRMVALALLALLLVRIGTALCNRFQAGDGLAGPIAGIVVFGHLFIELLRRSLGGFTVDGPSTWKWQEILLAFAAVAIIWLGLTTYRSLSGSRGVIAGAGVIFSLGTALFALLRQELLGFGVETSGAWSGPEFVLFLDRSQEQGIGSFNNISLMVILIWIQTGFAMVILSAAIKAVPAEYIEAARVDGATRSQIFFNITLPSILPTVGVITTTLIVLVAKVFDIVQVSTGGQFGTNVLANDFFKELTEDEGLSAAIATLILISVLPVMVLNIRRMQLARAN